MSMFYKSPHRVLQCNNHLSDKVDCVPNSQSFYMHLTISYSKSFCIKINESYLVDDLIRTLFE